jgi:hypothetical protein
MLLTVDLSQAERDYLISNTPLFLLRKLQGNPVVQQISQNTSRAVLLSTLRTSLKREPRTLKTAVRPYAFLVALAMKRGGEIKEIAKWKAPHHRWFNFMATVLSTTSTTPTSRLTVDVTRSPNLVTISSG